MPGSNSGSPSCFRSRVVNSLINALKIVGELLLQLIGIGVGMAVFLWAVSFLVQVGETTGSDSVLNLVVGVLLFMASLGIMCFVLVWGHRDR